MSIPVASKEMVRWVHRPLATIEGWWKDRDFWHLCKESTSGPSMAEIVLYQFLEFTEDCYDRDMTEGSGATVKDVYGREVIEKYEKLAEFYNTFKARDSAKRDKAAGEVPSEAVYEKMSNWAEGSI